MKLNYVQALVSAAEFGGIRPAARSLGISQVALAKQIKELEESVGHRLFIRTSRGVQLTADGAKILPRARSVIEELSRLDQEAGNLGSQTLYVALSPIVMLLLFGSTLERFRAKFPRTLVKLSEGLMSPVIPRLRDGSLDFAVVAGQGFGPDSDLRFEPCFNTANVFVGRKAHPLADHTSTLSELTKFEWVQNESSGGYSDRLRKWFAQEGSVVPTFVACESFATIIGVLLASNSVACAPAALLEHPIIKGNLCMLRSTLEPPRSTIGFLCRRDIPLSPAAAELKEIIRASSRSLTGSIPL
jgi:LysR family transcriptional regulator of abg operon